MSAARHAAGRDEEGTGARDVGIERDGALGNDHGAAAVDGGAGDGAATDDVEHAGSFDHIERYHRLARSRPSPFRC